MKISRWIPFLLSIIILGGLMFFGKDYSRPVYIGYAMGIILVFLLGPKFNLESWHEVGAYSLLLLGGFATFNGWWSIIPHFDKLMHFTIHLLVGFVAAEFWSRFLRNRPGYLILASIATVVLIGYILELVEQLFWMFLGISMAPIGEFYTDTMADMMVNLGGGLVGIGIWWNLKK